MEALFLKKDGVPAYAIGHTKAIKHEGADGPITAYEQLEQLNQLISSISGEFSTHKEKFSTHKEKTESDIRILNGETTKKVFTGYTAGAVKYTISTPDIYLVAARGNINSPYYMLLVGKWGTATPTYNTIVSPVRATISFSGDEITIDHENNWGAYSIVKLT